MKDFYCVDMQFVPMRKATQTKSAIEAAECQLVTDERHE